MILPVKIKTVWFTPPGKPCWAANVDMNDAKAGPEFCPRGAYSETEIVACDDASEIETAKARHAMEKADKAKGKA